MAEANLQPPPPDEPDPDSPVDVADKLREPTAYEKKLRTENAKYRLRALEAEKRATEASETSKRESETLVNAAKSEANLRIIRAELKAAAIKAGMVDLDGLKLLDLASVKLNDDGEVEGAEALMAKAKESKPYLFGEKTATTSTSEKPKPDPVTPLHARDMTPEQRAKAMADYEAGGRKR